MKLNHTDIIDAPVQEVYRLVKEELPEIAKYLPSINRIEKKENTVLKNGQIKIVNHWYAKAEMPSLLKKFLSEDIFSWKDIAKWDDKKLDVTYELESFFTNDLFHAKGHNLFEAHEINQTKLTLNCYIEIYPDKIPGIPKIMARSVQPAFEALIGKMLQPNMTSLGEGLRKYLAANPKS